MSPVTLPLPSAAASAAADVTTPWGDRYALADARG